MNELGYCLAAALGFFFGAAVAVLAVIELNARNDAEWEDMEDDEYWY